MFIRVEVVREAVDHLGTYHPFFGMGFLVCKKARLPVGRTTRFAFGSEEEEFLRTYYKPYPASTFYFQPFKSTEAENFWVGAKYPWGGSQSYRTRGLIADAFIHQPDGDDWGWKQDYVQALVRKLERDKTGKIPLFWLAIWLFRLVNWHANTTVDQMVGRFVNTFAITPAESAELFITELPENIGPIFTSETYSDSSLLRYFPLPPDAQPQEGGTIKYISLNGVGPAKSLEFQPAERLSIITGDNGLGKTFLLECAWWALTGEWAEQDAIPRRDARKEPSISFQIAAEGGHSNRTTASYEWESQLWRVPPDRPTIPGLIVYARVDGSFAVWDPMRHRSRSKTRVPVFTREQVFGGLDGQIEGLVRDWITWQHSPEQDLFKTFKEVLRALSPPDMMPLEPGKPLRLPGEARDTPTLRHPYEVVPITHESAGIRRIVAMAYLLVWAWNEHRIASISARKAPQERMVILIDEIEAHLHPKWQRVVLPAILSVTASLSAKLHPQIIVATHSPMILASVESTFTDETDKLFHLQLSPSGDVTFGEQPFVKFGNIDAWLTSDIFELREARSKEGEDALKIAKQLLSERDPDPQRIKQATAALTKVLPAQDEFWPRWLHFTRSKGVEP